MAGRLLALASLASGVGWCQKDLAEASLEQLLDTQVTTVSKKEQKLARTAAAVYVVSREDIIRSGATNIPDLLRMVPGVDVAQIDGSSWAISIRGFNARYSNKVLVLIDGRSVYSTSFSGVYWDQIDLPVAEIERIEVIRGPGGSVWGANAVNGVISIITRSSKATHGGAANLGAGSYTRASDSVSYGAAAGSRGDFRVWGAYNNVADSVQSNGAAGGDGWERVHGGFRSDWSLGRRDALTVEGDLFFNQGGHTTDSLFQFPGSVLQWQNQQSGGGSILGRWTRTSDGGADQSLQIYYSAFHRTELGVPISESSLDFDYQNRHRIGTRQEIVWGAAYRRTATDLGSASWISFSPPVSAESLYSAFVEDEIHLADNLWLTLGTRVEHNPYTGFDFEPSVRLAWTVTPSSTFWLSAGRAVRQPARADAAVDVELGTVQLASGMPAVLYLLGNPQQAAERVTDYEAGYRAQLRRNLSLDAVAFGSLYQDLATSQPLPPTMIQDSGGYEMKLPYLYANGAKSVDYGGELAANWNVTRRWRLSPAYSMLHVNYRLDPTSSNAASFNYSRCSPAYTWQIRSLLNLPARLSFDQSLSWTSRLEGNGIPPYWRLDGRVARRLGESAEISLVGQNLLQPRFLEFGGQYGIVGTELPRSVFGRVEFRF
jgi:iron complex outermembrane receptor protein